MASYYRSAFRPFVPSFALAAPVLVACSPLEPEVRTLEVRAHSIDASDRCRIEANPDLTLRALGPFPVSNLTAEQLPFRTDERTLTFPADTQGIEAEASDGDRHWLGYTERKSERSVDVLLWEAEHGCELFTAGNEPSSYPHAGGGQALGYSPAAGVVLVAGGDQPVNSPGTPAAGSLTFDSGTGVVAPVDSTQSFQQARAFATVTPFGAKLLLAGGENPLETAVAPEREARESAAVYDPALGGFEGDTIALELGRTRHAAVVLESGETLLIGGARPRGDGTSIAVAPFEAVSPVTRRSRIDGLVGLAVGRIEPSAVRLDDGRLLVVGGYDANGEALGGTEWFSADGSRAVSPGCGSKLMPCSDVIARPGRVVLALPGGGALTIGGCEPDDGDAECHDAWWIWPDGEGTRLKLEQPPDCPAPFTPDRVLLSPGSDGAPWLLAVDEGVEPPCRAVLRFTPWTPGFAVARPRFERWPDPRAPLASIGADAFVWLSDDDPPVLVGARLGTRGALSQNETLLDSDPNAPLVPLHLAPDRDADAADRPRALYRPEGRLILEQASNGYAPVTVTIADARYDDVTLTLDFTGDGPPLVVFGEYVLGSVDCPFPDAPETPLVITRTGTHVSIVDGAGDATTCSLIPSGALPVAFRAGRTSATLTSLTIRRN
jgi:hypothetical protein